MTALSVPVQRGLLTIYSDELADYFTAKALQNQLCTDTIILHSIVKYVAGFSQEISESLNSSRVRDKDDYFTVIQFAQNLVEAIDAATFCDVLPDTVVPKEVKDEVKESQNKSGTVQGTWGLRSATKRSMYFAFSRVSGCVFGHIFYFFMVKGTAVLSTFEKTKIKGPENFFENFSLLINDFFAVCIFLFQILMSHLLRDHYQTYETVLTFVLVSWIMDSIEPFSIICVSLGREAGVKVLLKRLPLFADDWFQHFMTALVRAYPQVATMIDAYAPASRHFVFAEFFCPFHSAQTADVNRCWKLALPSGLLVSSDFGEYFAKLHNITSYL